MKKYLVRASVAVISCVAFAACGGGNFKGNYTGTWTGSLATATSGNFSMTMYQNGSNASGDWYVTDSASGLIAGTVTGTVSGGTLTATFSLPAQHDVSPASTLTGSLTLSGSALSGPLTGTVNGTAATLTLSSTLTQ